MKKFLIFVVLLICIELPIKDINATGFELISPLRYRLIALNEGGFNFIKMETYKNTNLKDLQNEIWKDVKDYEGLYKVSNLGRVKSLKRKIENGTLVYWLQDTIIFQLKRKSGYVKAELCKNSKPRTFDVHRLVAKHFVENPHNKRTVNHKNAIKHDNKASNLEWMTDKENTHHSIKNKLYFHKPIIQLDLKGNIIKEWESAAIAGRAIRGCNSFIGEVCNGNKQTAYGYKWKYQNKKHEITKH